MKLTAKVLIIQGEGVFLDVQSRAVSGRLKIEGLQKTKGGVLMANGPELKHGDFVTLTIAAEE